MDRKKIIINIGRQFGSGGKAIATLLSEKFGCTLYDKELLNLAAKESGFCKEFFEKNDEKKGFFKSLFHMHMPYISDNNIYNNNISQEGLFQFQSDAIKKAADSGSCVFVGRCADYILRDYDNVVNIFIMSDIYVRTNNVCERLNCDRNKARKIINDKENSRASYYNYYTGKEWGNSKSYHICVDSSVLGIEGTAELLAEFIRKRFDI